MAIANQINPWTNGDGKLACWLQSNRFERDYNNLYNKPIINLVDDAKGIPTVVDPDLLTQSAIYRISAGVPFKDNEPMDGNHWDILLNVIADWDHIAQWFIHYSWLELAPIVVYKRFSEDWGETRGEWSIASLEWGGGGWGWDAVWGSITGNLSHQTDLQNALNKKVDHGTENSDWFAVGKTAEATGMMSFAVGPLAKATGLVSFAVGNGASAQANNAFAVGGIANKSWAMAIGVSSHADEVQTMAVGYGSRASDEGAMAIGHTAKARGEKSVAIWKNSHSIEENEFSVGSPWGTDPDDPMITLPALLRRITNVDDPELDTDAVNLRTLSDAIAGIIAGQVDWGSIWGTIGNQTDLVELIESMTASSADTIDMSRHTGSSTAIELANAPNAWLNNKLEAGAGNVTISVNTDNLLEGYTYFLQIDTISATPLLILGSNVLNSRGLELDLEEDSIHDLVFIATADNKLELVSFSTYN